MGGCEQETQRVIDLLVEAGCDLRATDDNGFGLMSLALMPDSYGGQGFASSDGINLEAAKALRRHGLSLDVTFPGGRTPLHIAATETDPSVVAFLLEEGADPNAQAANGETALDAAEARLRELDRWAEQQRSEMRVPRDWLVSQLIPAAQQCIELLGERRGALPGIDLPSRRD
jgi:hypothetical protein